MESRDEGITSKLIERRGEAHAEVGINHRGRLKVSWRLLKWENKKLWVVAGPGILTRLTSFGVLVITQAFIGHVGATELAGFSLACTVFVRFANGILLGMASALDTLCGQSYGAKQYNMLGIYLQKSWIILILCCLLLLPLFIFTTPILLLFHQERAIAEMAGSISLFFIPMIFAFAFSFTLQMYLQSQSKNAIILYASFPTLFLHIGLSWLLVVVLGMGLAGALTSMIVSTWVSVLGQLAFVFFGGCSDTWTGFSWTAFQDLGKITRLSVSSGVMICLELWYNTILVFLTGYMKDAETALDALSICLNINSLELMIPLGFLGAAGVRVANELGAGSSKNAKFAIINVVVQSSIIGVVLFAAFLFLRGQIAYLFTQNIAVVNAVAQLSPLMALSILLNSIQPVLSGVAVGAGWQGVVAYVNLACYYVIGIPLGFILAYVIGLRVIGIWSGMIMGTLCQTLVLIYITMRTDWEQQVAKSRERLDMWYMGESKESDRDQQSA